MYVHMLMFYMYNGSKFRYINLMDNTRATSQRDAELST